MDLELPVDLKFINTYLQRAKELKERDPVVAYYCQLYCVKLAIQKDIRSPESKQYLISIMNVLEEKKQKLASNEAITNEDIGFSHVENFGLKIFMNADKEDLNQGSTK
jgi:vacuolar protein sorting-associated protein VTA1